MVGRVTHAASAEQAGGRGELTLELDSVQPADGGRFDVHTKPLGLRAPAAPRKKDNAFIESLSDLSAAVGDLIGGRRGAAAGTVVGGTAGTMVVTTSRGREVALGAGPGCQSSSSNPSPWHAPDHSRGRATFRANDPAWPCSYPFPRPSR